jgi:hypothetical protein
MSLSGDPRFKIVRIIDVMLHDMTPVQMVYITCFTELRGPLSGRGMGDSAPKFPQQNSKAIRFT